MLKRMILGWIVFAGFTNLLMILLVPDTQLLLSDRLVVEFPALINVLNINNAIIALVTIGSASFVVWRLWRDIDRSLTFLLFFECVGLIGGFATSIVITLMGNIVFGGVIPAEIDGRFPGWTITVVMLFLTELSSLGVLIWSVWRARPVRRGDARHSSQRTLLHTRVTTIATNDLDADFNSCNSCSETLISSESGVGDESSSTLSNHTTSSTQGVASNTSGSAKRANDLLLFEQLLDNLVHRERFTHLLWTQFHAAAFSFCETFQLIRLLIRDNHVDDARKYLQLAVDLYIRPKCDFPVALPLDVREHLMLMCYEPETTPIDYDVINDVYYTVLGTLLDIYFTLMGTSRSEDDSSL